MAGHSQFKNIMHRKGAQDAKRAKLFNKIAREITVATKLGAPDPSANPRLRAAIAEARANNMTKDRIDRAIKAGTAGFDDGKQYEAVRYEGYGPGGIAIMVEALTDNRARTVAEMRTLFTKAGGNLGEANSVAFMFTRVAEMTYPVSVATSDAMFEASVDAGADDVASQKDADGKDQYVITTSPDQFGAVRDALSAKYGDAASAKITWRANALQPAASGALSDLMKLLDQLDDHDDVQQVIANLELTDAEMAALAS